MACESVSVEVNVGGPAPLDVVGARRGSRWFLPLAFSDDLSLSALTAAKITLTPVSGDS